MLNREVTTSFDKFKNRGAGKDLFHNLLRIEMRLCILQFLQ
jgi:hypothetical protein